MKLLFLILCSCGTIQSIAQQKFTITGTLSAEKEEVKIFTIQRKDEQTITDSAIVKNGKFVISGSIEEPSKVYLSIKRDGKSRSKNDMIQLFIGAESCTLTSKDNLSNATIKGSKAYNDYNALITAIQPVKEKMQELYKQYDVAYQAKDEAKTKELGNKIEDLELGEQADAYKKYLKDNPKSLAAIEAISSFAGYSIDYNKVNPVWLQIDEKIKQTKSGKNFSEKLAIAKKTRIGSPALLFTQNDVNGTPISLASFKGKYVLIDFWASWCGPCRKENPNVVASYEKYKTKNFTILGVSLDNKNQKDRWLKAIRDDNLTWTQVSDLNGFKNEVALLYGIEAIPQNLLIDPNGIIIAKNLREEKLSQKLAELLDK